MPRESHSYPLGPGPSPFARYAAAGTFGELYEVVQTAIVVRHGATHRLEVLKVHQTGRSGQLFTVRAYTEDAVESEGGMLLEVWSVDTGFPVVDGSDADDALAKGLAHLDERTRR